MASANKKNTKPNKERLKKGFFELKETLEQTGFDVITLEFPEELKKSNHDAVFIRDSGFLYKDYWIKANFSAKNRQPESEVYAKLMQKKFNKKIITPPKDAYIEFGEVIYLQTKTGTFYFGRLGRANKKGHDFVKDILKPDNYILIKSKGYHLDTVFSPVITKDKKLIAIMVAKEVLKRESFEKLKELDIQIIELDKKDSSDEDGLGTYAVNSLSKSGIFITGSNFVTKGVEEKLKELEIDFHVVPLKDFNDSGGSVHCLTNEFYE